MHTDVMDHPCELTTYSKLFFILVVKTTHVRLDSLAVGSHCTTCVIFFFIYVVNGILENLQKIECANGGKTQLSSAMCIYYTGQIQIGTDQVPDKC